MKLSEQIKIALQIAEALEAGDILRWERFDTVKKEWVECTGSVIGAIHGGYQIRLKPKTIVINGFEVPEPLRQAPPHGAEYYLVDACFESMVGTCIWDNGHVDNFGLCNGLIHSTEEAAKIHAKALLSFAKSTKNEPS